MMLGPTWPVENGSVLGPLDSVAEYAIQVIKKMQNENIKSWVPKQDITDKFNAHTQEWIKHTVWKEDCRSWYETKESQLHRMMLTLQRYKDNETGRVNGEDLTSPNLFLVD